MSMKIIKIKELDNFIYKEAFQFILNPKGGQ